MLFLRYICRLKLSSFIKLLFLLFLLILLLVAFEIFYKEHVQKIILWWTPFMPNHDRLIKCGPSAHKCIISSNREYINHPKLGAFLFYGSKISNFDFPLPRNAQIPWAVFHEESPKNYAPFLYKKTQDLFNITSTFSQYSDFPVTLQYLKNVSFLTDKKYFVPTNVKNTFLEQLSPVLYIQSDCDTPIGRDYLVNQLSRYIKIDSYGKCLTNAKFPIQVSELYPLDLYHEDYMKFISKYKFIISFENAACEDYVTEKLWRPLIVGSIPIYLGSDNVEKWLPNRHSAILFKDFEDTKSLVDFINKVNNNDSLYESFLDHKLLGKIENKLLQKQVTPEYPVSEFECYLCEKIHENTNNFPIRNENVYDCPKPVPRKDEKNTWDQHWDVGKCQAKALVILIDNNKPYDEKTFEDTWKGLYYKNIC